MRRIKFSHTFKRDFRRVKSQSPHRDIDSLLKTTMDLLVTDMPLPASCVDHALKGKLKGYRDCHIKPDVVLIYRKQGNDVLELVRLGSHSGLGI
jgi:mRNA interferase YafQ